MTKQRKQALIAGACGIIAALCVFAYTATIQSEASMARASAIRSYGGERAEVLVANKTIPIGGTIDESNTSVQEWLVDFLPQGQAAQSYEELQGLVAQTEIRVNEPVLLERVGDGSSRITVPDGLAAASVASDDVLAVGGAIRAGSVVDVYVEASSGEITMLGEHILVLETSTLEDSKEKQISWVTLAVRPSSVSDLLAAASKGTIHFVLPGNSAANQED
ncbi:MAG: Flp pilus assembly protein CpaB [Coriobacteriia bacterium]|nr:MAG: Flp pilus assembly protein CpaB [Coriobacteriia bacterium]